MPPNRNDQRLILVMALLLIFLIIVRLFLENLLSGLDLHGFRGTSLTRRVLLFRSSSISSCWVAVFIANMMVLLSTGRRVILLSRR